MLLVGLYKDQGSPLRLLRAPNNVVQDVMPIIWKMLKNKWQVVKDILFWKFIFMIFLMMILTAFNLFLSQVYVEL